MFSFLTLVNNSVTIGLRFLLLSTSAILSLMDLINKSYQYRFPFLLH